MKILHIISQRPDSTGSGYYLQNLLRLCNEAGYESYLIAGIHKGETPSSETINNTPASYVTFRDEDLNFSLPGMSDVMPYESSKFSDLSAKELDMYEKIFKEEITTAASVFRPDIIHSHHLWIASAICRQILPELPMVTSCHSTDIRQVMQCEHLREQVINGCSSIDRILALSANQALQISKLYGIDQEKIDIVGSGYNDQLFSRQDKESPPPVHLLYAGKLSLSKGVDLLLRSCSQLQELPIHLHIVGSGSGREEALCLELAAKLKSKITLHGHLQQSELAELMRSCHLFILPSFYEGLPLVLLEALASGCRVITTDLPGCSELLAGAEEDLVEFLQLPSLETVDRPFEKDIRQLEQTLCKAIEKMIGRTIRTPEPDRQTTETIIRSYSWRNVFTRVEEAYRRAKKEKSLETVANRQRKRSTGRWQ